VTARSNGETATATTVETAKAERVPTFDPVSDRGLELRSAAGPSTRSTTATPTVSSLSARGFEGFDDGVRAVVANQADRLNLLRDEVLHLRSRTASRSTSAARTSLRLRPPAPPVQQRFEDAEDGSRRIRTCGPDQPRERRSHPLDGIPLHRYADRPVVRRPIRRIVEPARYRPRECYSRTFVRCRRGTLTGFLWVPTHNNPRFPAPRGTWEATGRRQTVMSNSSRHRREYSSQRCDPRRSPTRHRPRFRRLDPLLHR
jgi:hypothetical protein